MKIENSGKVYVIPLEFDLGYSVCTFFDYTDIAPFDGAVISVYNIQFDNLEKTPSIKFIENSKILFGFVPLNKYPNIKGKGAWKLIGKLNILETGIPEFKDTNHIIELHKAVDWSTVGGWKLRLNFTEGGKYFDYESVRNIEMLTLYNMRNIEIRATMHFLLFNKKNIQEYYDLTNDNLRNIYLAMANTSFDKKKALMLLKAVR